MRPEYLDEILKNSGGTFKLIADLAKIRLNPFTPVRIKKWYPLSRLAVRLWLYITGINRAIGFSLQRVTFPFSALALYLNTQA